MGETLKALIKRKIEIKKGKIITRAELFQRREKSHKKSAQLSFEDKIKILMNLWKITEEIKNKAFEQSILDANIASNAFFKKNKV